MSSRSLESTFEVFRTILVVLVFAFIIRAFIFQPFVVEGRSMEPTFQDHDYLLVNKFIYRFEDPNRGDVIVFEAPTMKNVNFIKRVIALPGELIKISSEGVFVNNEKFNEQYVNKEENSNTPLQTSSIERFLNADEYWVMGDNRNHSSDSREWGPLKRSAIIGKAWLTVFPTKDFALVGQPNY